MEKIERYIHGTINTLGCNLNCNYCYLKLQGVPQTTESKFEYSLNTIKKAMSRDRWGCCFISLCGKGETLMDSKVIDLMKVLLDNGHYINISTNGTMKKNMHIMIQSFPKDYIERTMLTISLHYNELKKRNLLDQYFSNIRALKNAGFSVLLQLVLADEYMPIIDEIKNRCYDELGVLPHVSMVRNETDINDRSLYSKYDYSTYCKIAESFDSGYFRLQKVLYEKKYIHDYCFAGDKGVMLDFSTGIMMQCLCNTNFQNVFEKPDMPVIFQPVGRLCAAPWCFCAVFQLFGLIPTMNLESYKDLYRENQLDWVSKKLLNALNVKLVETYVEKDSKNT